MKQAESACGGPIARQHSKQGEAGAKLELPETEKLSAVREAVSDQQEQIAAADMDGSGAADGGDVQLFIAAMIGR